MSSTPPTRKPVPQRTAPNRGGGGLYRSPPSIASDATADPSALRYSTTLDSGEDAVVYGVRAGYRVLDAQIRRGAEYARKLRRAYERQGGSLDRAAESSEALVEQWTRFGGELGETLLQTPQLLRWARTAWRGVSTEDAAAARSAGPSPAAQGDMLRALVEGLGLTVNSETREPASASPVATPPTVVCRTISTRYCIADGRIHASPADLSQINAGTFAPVNEGSASAPVVKAVTPSHDGRSVEVAIDATAAGKGAWIASLVVGTEPVGWIRVVVTD